ncbi:MULTISPECIES: hypothetical protein [Salipiger]|uniref:hypothetical protein n=1 Tax=Salipiger TaxID=263377 RepID=UPI00351624C4
MTQQTDTHSPLLRWLPIIAFAYVAFVTLARAPAATELLYALGNDSAMRLVSVRDLLAGQGWFDLTQSRLGLEGGFEMHWSRLIDTPIAGLVLFFDLFTDRLQAEILTITIWPLLMLAAVVALVTRIGTALGGAVAGPVSGALVAGMFWGDARFLPGAIDHHNAQVALLLLLLWGVIDRRDRRVLPVIAGLALAASLAIGVETLPLLALCTFGMAGFWLANGVAERGPVLRFALGAVGGLTLLFPALAPASAYLGGYCDAFSIDLALPVALGVGAMALAAACVSDRPLKTRAGVLLGLFAAVGALTLAATPACLSEPYGALDPYLDARWMAFVREARSLADLIATDAEPFLFGYYLLGLAAFGLALSHAWRQRSGAWLLIGVLLSSALAIGSYQLRGVFVLTALSAPVLGATTAELHRAWRDGRGTSRGLAALACALLALPMSWVQLVTGAETLADHVARPANAAPAAPDHDAQACFTPGAMAALAALPEGVVSAPSNFGTHVLLHSGHRTLSAPYHRNQDGMRAQLEITLAATPEAAQAALVRHGIDYMLVCPGDPELTTLANAGFDGFGHALEGGAVPGFLTAIPTGDSESALRIYRVN